MSDFVYPSYFETFHKTGSVQFDHMNKVTKPFQILSGGYQIVFKSGKWSQVFGSVRKEKAFKKEDGSSMIRFEMAYGKAYAALAMGRSSRLVKVRAEEKPIFMRYLISASGEQIFPEGGGLQIRNVEGEVIGAVGGTGDTEERDEELAAHGIRTVGLKTDEDCAGLGRRGGVRLTNT